MSGEDDGPRRGFSRVPPKKDKHLIEVDATPITEDAEAEGGSEPDVEVEAERDDPQGPLTLGEIVDGANKMIDDVSTQARRLIDRGRYRKVRISRKGKPLLPDIPLAAVAAIEAASMYGAGIARVLAVNVGARFLFDVEVVNEADKYFERGRQAVLDGDLERALEALEKAVRIDDTHAGAFLQLGVLFRLRGEGKRARPFLERARTLDENGEVGRRADEILSALDSARDR